MVMLVLVCLSFVCHLGMGPRHGALPCAELTPKHSVKVNEP